jgi:hypothetical protein
MAWHLEGTYRESCSHPDHLQWLDEEASLLLWGEAERRREL